MRYLAARWICVERFSSVAAVGIIMLVDSSNNEDLRRLNGRSAVVQPIGVRKHAHIPKDQDYQIPLKFTGKIDQITIKL